MIGNSTPGANGKLALDEAVFDAPAKQSSNPEKKSIVNLILFFWFLRLFKPEWLASYYVPSLSPLKSIPTVMLLVFVGYLFFSSNKVRFDKPMLWFTIAISLSTLTAQNFGIALPYMRGTIETLLIYAVITTFVSSEESSNNLVKIYLWSFVFFGIWGIGTGGKVSAMLPLDDEDSFGPFMAIGFALSYYLLSARDIGGPRRLRRSTFVISFLGAVASLARGTFVSLATVAGYVFLRSKNKIGLAFRSAIAGVVIVMLALTFAPKFADEYWTEVSSIWLQGTKERTANDRMYLWTRAVAMFADYPILGVGPGCYGHKVPDYITQESANEWGVRFQMYGRAIHNIFFQMLSETGLAGVIGLLGLLLSFRARNVETRSIARNLKLGGLSKAGSDRINSIEQYCFGLEAAMVAFLVNGFFFNLLFYSWFWDMLILNSLMHQRIQRIKASAGL